MQDNSATFAELSSPISHPAESVKTNGFAPSCSTPLKGFPKNSLEPLPSPRTPHLCPQHVTPASHKTMGRSSPPASLNTLENPAWIGTLRKVPSSQGAKKHRKQGLFQGICKSGVKQGKINRGEHEEGRAEPGLLFVSQAPDVQFHSWGSHLGDSQGSR